MVDIILQAEPLWNIILENPIERVVILLLVIAVGFLAKKINKMHEDYSQLLREVVAVMEQMPLKLEAMSEKTLSEFHKLQAELRIHMQQWLK